MLRISAHLNRLVIDPLWQAPPDQALVTRYQKRISGPLLDRFDMRRVWMCRAWITKNSPLTGQAKRVRPCFSGYSARDRQLARFNGSGLSCNADTPALAAHALPAALRSKRSEDARSPSASPALCAGNDGAGCRCRSGAHRRVRRVGRHEQGADAQHDESTGDERASVPPGVEAGADGSNSGRARFADRGDPPAASRGGRDETQAPLRQIDRSQ